MINCIRDLYSIQQLNQRTSYKEGDLEKNKLTNLIENNSRLFNKLSHNKSKALITHDKNKQEFNKNFEYLENCVFLAYTNNN